MNRRMMFAMLALIVVFGNLGCGDVRNGRQDAGSSDARAEDYPKLQRQLFELSVAEGKAALALRYQMDYTDDRVTVVVEYDEPRCQQTLEDAVARQDGQMEASLEGLLQASVTPQALLSLASLACVQFVRMPVRPFRN